MRDWPISWQWQQTKLANDTGSDMAVNSWESVQLETGYWHWQEDGSGEEGEPDTLKTWQSLTEKHPTLQIVAGPPLTTGPH